MQMCRLPAESKMEKQMTIETTRLKIYAASQDEMIRMIDVQTDDILRKAYQEMLYLKQFRNTDDVSVAKHFGFSLQVTTQGTLGNADFVCQFSLRNFSVFYQILDALPRIAGKVGVAHMLSPTSLPKASSLLSAPAVISFS